jgi:hypothetical protein
MVMAAACVQPHTASAQEVVAGRPPVYARVEKARAWLSPVTLMSTRIESNGASDGDRHAIEGFGLSLGGDFMLHRHAALWVNGHVGAVTGAEADVAGERTRLAGVEGSFRSLAVGAAGVLSDSRWTGLIGLGLFAMGADWDGHDPDSLTPVDTQATLIGAVATLRGDYTLRNGFFFGAGVDAGLGVAGGDAADGGDPRGDWLVFYIPLGWTY